MLCVTRSLERINTGRSIGMTPCGAFHILKRTVCTSWRKYRVWGTYKRNRTGINQFTLLSLWKFTLSRGLISLILSIQKLRLCHWIHPLLLRLGHCFSCEVSYRLEKAFYRLRRRNLETGSLQKMPNLPPWEFLNQVRKISLRRNSVHFVLEQRHWVASSISLCLLCPRVPASF